MGEVSLDIRLLSELVSFPSFTGRRSYICEYAKDFLEEFGYDITLSDSNPHDWCHDIQGSPPLSDSIEGAQYLIGYPPKERDSGLLYFAHYDTESRQNEGKAFTLIADDRKYYGHGIADDKAGVAAILLTIGTLVKDSSIKLPAVVLAQAKQGGCFGMSKAISEVKNRSAAVYSHPAESNQGFRQIKTASRGIATFEITFIGIVPTEVEENTPASADPRTGVSALHLASSFIQEIGSWNDDSIVWLVTDLQVSNRDFQVAKSCSIKVSAWFQNTSVDMVHKMLCQRFHSEDWEVIAIQQDSPRIIGIRANPAVTTDAGFIQLVKDCVKSVTRENVSEYGWHAASDIRFPLLHLGIPTVGLGCIAGGFYGGEEWVEKQSFHDFVTILSDILRRYSR